MSICFSINLGVIDITRFAAGVFIRQSVEDATHGVSVPRNKLLFNNGIYLLPYTGAGSGLTRARLFTPDIKFENNENLKEFVVTIQRNYGEVRGEVDGGVYGGVINKIPYRQLNGIQKDIIQYCSIPRTSREILEHINYKYHSDAVAKFIKPLVEMGYLEYTIPDKPNSPKQKYRKK